jgi:hypothetical protein
MQRFDDPLCPSAVPDRLTCGHDAVAQGRIADELLRPELAQKFLFGHDAVALTDKIGEEIEDLGLEWQRCSGGAELKELSIEFVVAKAMDHLHYPRCVIRRRHRGSLWLTSIL